MYSHWHNSLFHFWFELHDLCFNVFRWGIHLYTYRILNTFLSVCPSFHPLCTISQKLYIMWSWFLLYRCKMMKSPGIFFIFVKFRFFVLLRGRVKGQKLNKKKKQKLHLSCIVFQEKCSVWSWFSVDLCKVMISPGILFSFFQNFNFSGCYRGKRAKNGPKWQKILSVAQHISGTMHHMIVTYGRPV